MSDLKETKAEETKTEETCSHKPANVCGSSPFAAEDADQEATQMTCDVLCSLSSLVHQKACERDASSETTSESIKQRGSGKSCPKQLQLPMFLSKTYHMIDKCDSDIATWSEAGDNFVVKNIEKFATLVLPLYFKHSNFSSFARQLNFYGFRKLRTDPILTNDVDPRTACYVRFYHEKFQRSKPELLHQIKRATKSDQQSKDDVDSLKAEVTRLRETQVQMKDDFDRRLAELSYECNRRVTALNADYDKLLTLVQPLIRSVVAPPDPAASAAAALRDLPSRTQMPDLLHSLSHAAVSLQNHLRSQHHQSFQQHGAVSDALTGKRPGEDLSSASSRPRYT